MAWSLLCPTYSGTLNIPELLCHHSQCLYICLGHILHSTFFSLGRWCFALMCPLVVSWDILDLGKGNENLKGQPWSNIDPELVFGRTGQAWVGPKFRPCKCKWNESLWPYHSTWAPATSSSAGLGRAFCGRHHICLVVAALASSTDSAFAPLAHRSLFFEVRQLVWLGAVLGLNPHGSPLPFAVTVKISIGSLSMGLS